MNSDSPVWLLALMLMVAYLLFGPRSRREKSVFESFEALCESKQWWHHHRLSRFPRHHSIEFKVHPDSVLIDVSWIPSDGDLGTTEFSCKVDFDCYFAAQPRFAWWFGSLGNNDQTRPYAIDVASEISAIAISEEEVSSWFEGTEAKICARKGRLGISLISLVDDERKLLKTVEGIHALVDRLTQHKGQIEG